MTHTPSPSPEAVLTASHVLWPDGTLSPGFVVVADGMIQEVGRPSGQVPHRILSPGFVDLQVNGHGDVDVATAHGADWDRLDADLIAQGVTTWCPTVTTAPFGSMLESLQGVDAAALRIGPRPAIAGAHAEGPFLGRRVGAHPTEHVRPPADDDVDALARLARVVTLGPEVDGALDAVRRLVDHGVVVSLGHSDATARQATDAVDAGARLVTHLFNAMAPLRAREPGLAGVALADERLAVSIIADLVHVHVASLRLAARSVGAGRLVLVTDAVGWRSPRMADRGVALVDGAPRLPDGTIAGSALRMDAAICNLVQSGITDLSSSLRAATRNPAAVLGLRDRGEIRVGARADLVALRPDLTVAETWVAGVDVTA